MKETDYKENKPVNSITYLSLAYNIFLGDPEQDERLAKVSSCWNIKHELN